ncbi:MAG TPA: hypothetical protein VNS09_06065, partial [Solirubrobacter sp.]|nr:hypothetical protein [Solirubrobacter sp.]
LADTDSALPKGCATDVQLSGGRLVSVNGVAADAQHEWVVSVNGGPASARLAQDVALGSVVRAALVARDGGDPPPPAATPTPAAPELPPVTPVPAAEPRRARAALASGNRRLRLRGGRVSLRLSCPRGLGATGCQGVVRVQYTAGKRTRTAGSAAFKVRSGARTTVRVKLNAPFRRLVTHTGRAVRLVAATRDQATRSTTVARLRARVRR